ncbi:MAG: 3-hydroxyacyl-CoA dehydrogenase NAD-binding domain-containing protein [Thermoanaerobaculia bacterium]|jgi:3-hydroxyacyl-CoA dehydrogenase/enoyl-CoA hydratase/3-hydroxybutyryl-CoA epimerase
MSAAAVEQAGMTLVPGKAFRLEIDGEDAVLWFDLPGEKVNKFSTWVLEELDGFIATLATRPDLKRVYIASPKPGIFIAGADVEEFTKVASAEEALAIVARGQRVLANLRRLPQATFAVINGACMGGGTELALACDYRLVSDAPKAAMALPEVNLGIFPAWGGTTYLPRLIGIPAALDMILTGKSINGKRGKKMGLVDEVVPASTALAAARSWGAAITGKRKSDNRNTHFYIEGNPLARRVIFNKAKAAVIAKSGGHYPAPVKAIEVMDIAFSRGIEEGLKAEGREAAGLFGDRVAKNLVGLFFLIEDAKKERGPAPGAIGAAGVLGAGLMGSGIAQVIADKADISVRIKDLDWKALGAGMKSASRVWKKKAERGRLTRGEMSRKLAKLTTTTDWSGFHHADLVIEAVLEKLELKQQVLREFEEIAKDGAIFATNTSTIPITKIAEGAKHPDRVVGMHFFSPVDKMPLLEIIAGAKTSPATVATAVSFGRKLGKTVVVCKDGPGFVVNRILGPYMNEAGFLLEEGFSIAAIDMSLVKFGMPLGPLNLLDEVGIDVAQKAGQVLAAAFGDRAKASKLVDLLVADERFGKKNGRGVYLWVNGRKTGPDPAVYKLLGTSGSVEGDGGEIAMRLVAGMVNEAAMILDEGIASCAADVDLAMIMGTGFPPFRGGLLRHADDLGIAKVVGALRALEERHGARFAPSAALLRVESGGRGFYDSYPRV